MDAAHEHRPQEPATHYEVLGLNPTILDSQNDTTALLKRAYHRALLRHHPDKAPTSTTKATTTRGPCDVNYSIDQITTAFTTLASPSRRAAYDASLRLATSSASGDSQRLPRFQTGLESTDLDDLAFDDQTGCWYRSCRCGNERGYVFGESDLEAAADEGELMVGCLDCSLWLKVSFAVV